MPIPNSSYKFYLVTHIYIYIYIHSLPILQVLDTLYLYDRAYTYQPTAECKI